MTTASTTVPDVANNIVHDNAQLRTKFEPNVEFEIILLLCADQYAGNL